MNTPSIAIVLLAGEFIIVHFGLLWWRAAVSYHRFQGGRS